MFTTTSRSSRIYRSSLQLTICLTAACCGCSGGPSRVAPPSIDADESGAQAMAQYDRDNDGLLSKDELENCPAILHRIERYDFDQDGQVSAAEIAKRVGELQKSKVALMPLGVKVTFNGRPLAGAEVRLIPETFLGEAVQSASGTTDKYGMTTPAIAADKLPADLADIRGVHLGLYQVEISHPKKKLGVQRLGTEIDHTDQWNGLRFDLKKGK